MSTDIIFGNRHGMQTFLVFTGHATESSMHEVSDGDEKQASYYAETAAILGHT